MLRITIEMLPAGDRKRAKILYRGFISRQSMNKAGTHAHYWVELRTKAGKIWKQGMVHNFPRRRLLAWDLLQWGLNVAIGDER